MVVSCSVSSRGSASPLFLGSGFWLHTTGNGSDYTGGVGMGRQRNLLFSLVIQSNVLDLCLAVTRFRWCGFNWQSLGSRWTERRINTKAESTLPKYFLSNSEIIEQWELLLETHTSILQHVIYLSTQAWKTYQAYRTILLGLTCLFVISSSLSSTLLVF